MTIGLSPISAFPEAYAWIDADGNEHVFDHTTGYQIERVVTGRWWPPVDWIEDKAPGIPGAVPQSVQIGPLDWDMPLHISGDTPAQLHQRVRALMYWLDPRRGDGQFKNTAADGSTRLLTCRVEQVAFPEDAPGYRKAMVSLHAADPYWYADEEETATYSEDISAPATFFPITFPFLFPSNTLFDAPTIDNPGDTESWPTWRIVGPGTNPSLQNRDTGEVMTFTRTLAAGDTILVELSRESVIVTDSLGTRLYSIMTNPSRPWPIRPGINRVQIGMSNATSASSITLTYTPRFIGP